jgi:hypothetical protein
LPYFIIEGRVHRVERAQVGVVAGLSAGAVEKVVEQVFHHQECGAEIDIVDMYAG